MLINKIANYKRIFGDYKKKNSQHFNAFYHAIYFY